MELARAAPVAAHDHRPSASEYERRRPEGTVLHQVVSAHWGAFVEHAEEQGRPLPSFVQREVEAYLRCGMLEHGLLRLGCPACGFERLGAFSCVEPDEPPRRKPWAWLLEHVYLHDVSVCPRCQGPTTWLEVATEPAAIDRAMADHGLAPYRARPPPLPRVPPEAQLALPL